MNVQRLEGQRLGVGRYLEYLIRDWAGLLGPEERMTLFCRRPLLGSEALGRTYDVRVLRPALTGALWENLVLGPRSGDVDVLFGPSYTLPQSRRGRSVVAVHSVNETVAGTHSWWHNHTYVAAYRASARRAERVIVPSESTAADVAAGYGVARERIVVVPQGTDDAFVRDDDPQRASATRRALLGADEPFVLFVGKLSQRRNIPALIEAFARAKHRAGLPHRLLLFGPNHLGIPLEKLAADAGVAGAVVQTDGVVDDHARLVDVYNAADLFVHPSSYEGWSMTTMEALACGTAVVAANRGGLGEVAAGHALLVDDPTAEALADAIEAVLTDERLREELRRKAELRGGAIRWSHTTRGTLDVLREVAAQ